MTTTLSCDVALPADYQRDTLLAFHRRDAQETAERVTPQSLQKGLIWQGRPACLTITFDQAGAHATLDAEGNVSPAQDQAAFESMVQRMLGLNQDVAAFEARHRDHHQLGRLIAQQAGLRVPAAATPFEALTWAVTGQQISVSAAVSLRRRLIQTVGVQSMSGLYCHPDAAHLARLNDTDLRQAGFSQTKADTVLTLARLVDSGDLPLDEWLAKMPVDQMHEQLMAIRGIGPWTINYVLLRGFGWLDGSLHGDVAVRRSLQNLLGQETPLSEAETKAWLAAFSPWRALIAAHLWAMRSAKAY